MRQSIGSIEVFKYALIFTLLFAAFITLTISYNKVFKVKNETISIIEKYEGINDKAIGVINSYLSNSGYKTKNKCNTEYGVSDYNNNHIEKVDSNTKYYYCIDKVAETSTIKVTLFYKFDLPVLGDLFTFRINGQTDKIIM